MKKLVSLVCIITLFISCDDGDLIVTNLDFDDVTLERCEDFEYVFYKINTDTNETIALQFSTSDSIFEPRELTYTLSLSGNDEYSYRRFNSEVPGDYFCNAIPPATPIVDEEFLSTVGDVEILTLGTEQDADGIPTEIENIDGINDYDMDGIPDFLDFDDDGDNVPTALEGVVLTEDGTAIDIALSRDFDGDGILDYLDVDDDGDGILTRNEDANMDLNPTNDNSDPDNPTVDDYLNPAIAVETVINEYRPHIYIITDLTLGITITNTILINTSNGEELRDETIQSLGTYEAEDRTIIITPDFN